MTGREAKSTARESRWARARRRVSLRDRGSVAVLLALLLPMLLALAALAIDVGYVLLVRASLQNAADAAAHAGARRLNGTVPNLDAARTAAVYMAGQHLAGAATVTITPNDGNGENGDVVLGRWRLEAVPPFFDASANPTAEPLRINAVRVRTARDPSHAGALRLWFGALFGRPTMNTAAVAVAVGGGPSTDCAFPVTVPDCLVRTTTGALRCDEEFTLRFNNDWQDNAGLTSLTPRPPVTGALVARLIRDIREGGQCVRLDLPADTYVQNGNDFRKVADEINRFIADNGGRPIRVTLPVLHTSMTPSACETKFNGDWAIDGFARFDILSASGGGGKDNTMQARLVCGESDPEPGGGGAYGLEAHVFLAQ